MIFYQIFNCFIFLSYFINNIHQFIIINNLFFQIFKRFLIIINKYSHERI